METIISLRKPTPVLGYSQNDLCSDGANIVTGSSDRPPQIAGWSLGEGPGDLATIDLSVCPDYLAFKFDARTHRPALAKPSELHTEVAFLDPPLVTFAESRIGPPFGHLTPAPLSPLTPTGIGK
jgi:hypothetical protein